MAELINERRSRRLPEGLLDQPFTAGLVAEHCSKARFSGFTDLYRHEGSEMSGKLKPQSQMCEGRAPGTTLPTIRIELKRNDKHAEAR